MRSRAAPCGVWLPSRSGRSLLQAALGGVTVLLRLPTAVSVAHAALAQAFFCLMVSLALVTGRGWLTDAANGADGFLDSLSAVTTAAVYRNFSSAPSCATPARASRFRTSPWPSGGSFREIASFTIGIHFAHRVGAVVVTTLVLATAARTVLLHREDSRRMRPALLLVFLLVLQVTLGREHHLDAQGGPADDGARGRGRGAAGDERRPGASRLARSRASRELGARSDRRASARVIPAQEARLVHVPVAGGRRLLAYLDLAKPRVVLMIVLTTLVGFYLGARGPTGAWLLFHTMISTAMAAAGTLALNQYLERDLDAVMLRTRSATVAGRQAFTPRRARLRQPARGGGNRLPDAGGRATSRVW